MHQAQINQLTALTNTLQTFTLGAKYRLEYEFVAGIQSFPQVLADIMIVTAIDGFRGIDGVLFEHK